MKKKKISKAQALVLPFFPEEIITDILTRLPVKTLIRFRSVSKSWLNLISNPNFINTHLLKSSKTKTFSQQKLILWHKSTVDDPQSDSSFLKSYSLHSLFDNGNVSNGLSLELDYKSNGILGSCNGLVCILMRIQGILIWNPSTGASKKLSIWETVSDEGFSRCNYGFGYDKVNDDYKISQMEIDLSVKDSIKVVAKLYSLRTNSWRQIGDFPNGYPYPFMAMFVNGALHWTIYTVGNYSSFVLVSLDLGNETYGEIAQPDYGAENYYNSLVILDGCISICCEIIGMQTDIWVMKEYGLRDSWVKLYTIPRAHIPKRNYCLPKVMLCNPVTGEILLKDDEMLLIYYPNYGTSTSTRIQIKLCSPQSATTYVESLVSP